MANVGGGVESTGLFKGVFGKIFKWDYLLIIILFIQAISIGINQGSYDSVLQSLGEKFFNITQDLQMHSQEIIGRGALFRGYWDLLLVGWYFFCDLSLVYLWIKLFVWLWGASPFSNDSNKFINFLLGFLTFIFFQVIYLFFFSTRLEGQTNLDLFKTPLWAFYYLFKALVLIFSSVNFENTISPIINSSNVASVCSDSSGCII
jgi:hypothetical protein